LKVIMQLKEKRGEYYLKWREGMEKWFKRR